MVPRIWRTIRAKSQKRQPMLCFPLLLAGIPMSTNPIGESVSHKAIVGMFPKAPSLIGWQHKNKIKISQGLNEIFALALHDGRFLGR